MHINILKDGDEVIGVTSNFISVRHSNGEVDLIPLVDDRYGLRVDTDKIVTIGYGDNEIVVERPDGGFIMNI